MQKKFSSFIVEKSQGVVAIIVALMISIFFLILLLTVNFSDQQTTKFNAQGGADSASLAVAQYLTKEIILNNGAVPTDYEAKAEEAFKANATATTNGLTRFVSATAVLDNERNPSKVTVTGCFDVSNNYDLNEATKNNSGKAKFTTVCSEATAIVGTFRNAEVVFALDVSASMNEFVGGNRKIDVLRTAVNDIKNQFGPNPANNVYWGIVPFRGMVDLGNYGPRFTNSSPNDAGEFNEWAFGGAGKVDLAGRKNQLQRVPLTERASSNSVAFDDDSNPSQSRFKSYGYHDKHYWFFWNNELNCSINNTRNRCIVRTGGEIQTDRLISTKKLCKNICRDGSGWVEKTRTLDNGKTCKYYACAKPLQPNGYCQCPSTFIPSQSFPPSNCPGTVSSSDSPAGSSGPPGGGGSAPSSIGGGGVGGAG